MITYQDIIDCFKHLGLQAGDALMMHSSYVSLGSVKGGVEGGPQSVIDALLQVLTEDGTLIMPTFNFDFTRGIPWDINSTPSQMGILTEFVRQDPRSCRVLHPIHSFSIIGKNSRELCDQHYRGSFERNSILGRLRDLDGKIMVMGLTYNKSLTFFHHVEEMVGVDWRYQKEFSGEITDRDGHTRVETYKMFVRDLDRTQNIDYNPLGLELEKHGLVKTENLGNGSIKLMKANQIYPVLEEQLRKKPYALLGIEQPGKNV